MKTNLEAASEIAGQLKLRDLAGLIVIDFIDMEERKNNIAVEKKMKDCISLDRARHTNWEISSFGCLEMSRQRLHLKFQLNNHALFILFLGLVLLVQMNH